MPLNRLDKTRSAYDNDVPQYACGCCVCRGVHCMMCHDGHDHRVPHIYIQPEEIGDDLEEDNSFAKR